MQFIVGKTYTTRSIVDYNCIISATITKRTAKTVTATVGGKDKTFKPFMYDGCECFMPFGRHSMAPTIRAA